MISISVCAGWHQKREQSSQSLGRKSFDTLQPSRLSPTLRSEELEQNRANVCKYQILKCRLFELWVFDEGFGTLVPDRPWITLLAFAVNSELL